MKPGTPPCVFQQLATLRVDSDPYHAEVDVILSVFVEHFCRMFIQYAHEYRTVLEVLMIYVASVSCPSYSNISGSCCRVLNALGPVSS
jgi:hypothetical protein